MAPVTRKLTNKFLAEKCKTLRDLEIQEMPIDGVIIKRRKKFIKALVVTEFKA